MFVIFVETLLMASSCRITGIIVASQKLILKLLTHPENVQLFYECLGSVGHIFSFGRESTWEKSSPWLEKMMIILDVVSGYKAVT